MEDTPGFPTEFPETNTHLSSGAQPFDISIIGHVDFRFVEPIIGSTWRTAEALLSKPMEAHQLRCLSSAVSMIALWHYALAPMGTSHPSSRGKGIDSEQICTVVLQPWLYTPGESTISPGTEHLAAVGSAPARSLFSVHAVPHGVAALAAAR